MLPIPTQAELQEAFEYSPETGALFWRRCRAPVRTQDTHGYLRARYRGHAYQAHRLIWTYVTGQWPRGHVDHINGDRTDNRIENLRLASSSQNAANSIRRKNNKSGFKGVFFDAASGRWLARIKVNGRSIHLGTHQTGEGAHAAYAAAARNYFGEFAKWN